MGDLDKRLDGWKSIAAFFGRDRNTVARWARERGLPVHHIPGGKQKTVFAHERELKEWQSAHADLAPEGEGHSGARTSSLPGVQASVGRGWSGWRLLAAGLGVVICLGGVTLLYSKLSSHSTAAVAAPAMADYVAARDAWARRTPEDIRRAIQLYERIIKAAPGFAPARAGLAEAWLIYREYGQVSDARAFGIARIAAEKAASLDPNLPDAHRALGFIDYWWDNDPVRASEEFLLAIRLDEKDAQTHFWFANILADLGKDGAAQLHYQRAKLLSPGSQPIAVEYACAQWQAGRDQLALEMMTELRKRYPTDATISNCLTWIHMGRGDIVRFAREFATLARQRGEPELSRLSQALDQAIARDPATAHRVLIADARRELSAGTRRIREVPAFYASSMGDRTELVKLMHEAQILGERWYSPAITSRIAARWKDDREIVSLLADLRVTPPEIPGI